MSSNKYLSAFFTSAAALGGLYLLDRFLGGQTRGNPRRYIHSKTFDEFTDEEKVDIAKRYVVNKESATSIARQESTTNAIIQRILEDQGCEIRDTTDAVILAHKKVLTEDQEAEIIRLFNISPNITKISEKVQLSHHVIKKFLVEAGLHHMQRQQELSDDDKEKLIAAKKAANAQNERLPLKNIGTKLRLTHKEVAPFGVLRLFAENGLNRPQDMTRTSLTEDQKRQILSYFKDGDQKVTLDQIIEDVGTEKIVLRSFLFYNNIVPKSPTSFLKRELDEYERDLMISLLEEGKTNTEIALELGMSTTLTTKFIDEYREQQGRTTSRLSESQRGLRDRLVTRGPDVVRIIMDERGKSPPTSYKKIASKLREEKGLSIKFETVRAIHREELSKNK